MNNNFSFIYKNKANIKKFMLIILLIFNYSYLFSNPAFPKKNNVSFLFSNISLQDNSNILLNENMVNLFLEYNRNIVDYFSIGGYSGIGLFEEWIFETDENSASIEFLNYKNSVHLGFNSKVHVLPLILKTNIPRFDVYLTGKLGIISLLTLQSENIIPNRGHYFDYSSMVGGSFYISEKIGLNTEIGYKNFQYHKGFYAKYGLTFRF